MTIAMAFHRVMLSEKPYAHVIERLEAQLGRYTTEQQAQVGQRVRRPICSGGCAVYRVEWVYRLYGKQSWFLDGEVFYPTGVNAM